jgi:hypothetical protein
VALTRRAQAQDETQFAVGQPGLVRVRNDRGIEEGRGFERVFAGEERSDVELAGLGERTGVRHMNLHMLEMAPPG